MTIRKDAQIRAAYGEDDPAQLVIDKWEAAQDAPPAPREQESEWKQRVWLCHQLLQDAVAVIDPEEYPAIVDSINEELLPCDEGSCPAPRPIQSQSPAHEALIALVQKALDDGKREFFSSREAMTYRDALRDILTALKGEQR